MKAVLASVQACRINILYVVRERGTSPYPPVAKSRVINPSILASLVGNPFLFKVFDLSSVKSVYAVAGSVSAELIGKVKAVQPSWDVICGYGEALIRCHEMGNKPV